MARRGAPITPRNRVPCGLRMTPEMRDRVVEIAAATGRSITQTIEHHLERSLALTDRLDRIEAKLDRLLGEDEQA